MQRLRRVILGGLSCVAAAFLALAAAQPVSAAGRAEAPSPLPPGITTYDRGDGMAFANAQGMTLYSASDDPRFRTCPVYIKAGGAKLCAGLCLEIFAPHLVPKDTPNMGDWGTIAWDDNARQLTYKGFPLFTFKLETKPHQAAADGYNADIGIAGKAKVWRVMYEPMQTPPGTMVRAAPAIRARVLANAQGMTAYTYDKDTAGKSSTCVGECTTTWRPMLAPHIVFNIGADWSSIRRDDGTMQWAYKGKPLYTYEADEVPGDATGEGQNNAWRAAVVRRANPTPEGITIGYSPRYASTGRVYADKDGRTLYAYYHDDIKRLATICNAECMKNNWQPAIAPREIKEFGPWTSVKADDGAYHWTYQGKPVYTFVRDKKLGDMLGASFGQQPDQSGTWGVVYARPPY
jgi:predicted lipoprotein with Yx(FWY)xxD motif